MLPPMNISERNTTIRYLCLMLFALLILDAHANVYGAQEHNTHPNTSYYALSSLIRIVIIK